MAMLHFYRGFSTVIGVLLVSQLLVPLPVAAAPDSGIPNLLGQWSVAGQGAVLCKVQASRCKTHHHGDFDDLKATVQITRQQGRLVHGVYTSKYASESFVAAIGHDNKSFYLVDEDGYHLLIAVIGLGKLTPASGRPLMPPKPAGDGSSSGF